MGAFLGKQNNILIHQLFLEFQNIFIFNVHKIAKLCNTYYINIKELVNFYEKTFIYGN